ncbi:MAG: hypothetical protein HY315_08750 [Acidobacteria bacterium]|nr:hypothetical protein [Acidobacteriota bacterium]
MKLLEKPFAQYLGDVKPGIILLILLAAVRFLLKPLFQVPYERGTNLASVTILLFILIVFYSVKAARSSSTYRDLLGIAAALSLTTALLIIVGIAIDDFGGIDTYYTDLAHGGNLNPWVHMGAHAAGGLIFTLLTWGVGSLVFRFTGGGQKTA